MMPGGDESGPSWFRSTYEIIVRKKANQTQQTWTARGSFVGQYWQLRSGCTPGLWIDTNWRPYTEVNLSGIGEVPALANINIAEGLEFLPYQPGYHVKQTCSNHILQQHWGRHSTSITQQSLGTGQYKLTQQSGWGAWIDSECDFLTISVSGSGTIYDLEIERYAGDNSPPVSPQPSFASGGVIHSITPTGAFSFQVSGKPNSTATLYRSDDLLTWITLTNVAVGTSGEFSYVDSTAAQKTSGYYKVKFADATSPLFSPIFGFSKVTLNANQFTALSSPFETADRKVSTLLPNAADGTLVYTWNHGTQSYDILDKDFGIWSDPNRKLPLATGFTVRPTVNTTLVFQGLLPRVWATEIKPGYNFIGDASPKVESLSQMGFPALNGDKVQIWNKATQVWETSTFNGSSWSPNPSVSGLDGFFYWRTGSTANSWSRHNTP
jgi:hypothetical protein